LRLVTAVERGQLADIAGRRRGPSLR